MKNKTVVRPQYLFLIFFSAALSLGAWWDLGKPKKEEPKKNSPSVSQTSQQPDRAKNQSTNEQTVERKETGSEPQKQIQKPILEVEIPTPGLKANLPPIPVAPKILPVEPIVSAKVPTPAELAQIQKDLNDIIVRSSKLQDEVKENRTEVLQIMERAKIHESILKTIKIPQPVKMPVKVVDADAIVQREKLRLIAEQTRQAQKQLETFQRTRSIQSQRTSS